LRLITSDIAVPTLLCALHESTPDRRRHLLQYGAGTHPDAFVAARRAITEATQSRVTAMQGAREDMAAGAICPVEPPDDWFGPQLAEVELADIPRAVHSDVRDDLAFILDALDAACLDPAVVVNLTNEVIGFPVVKAVVPGLEPAFHNPDPDHIAFGWRARRYFAGSQLADGLARS
jgi:ribosomal protein S12 methylthiotransferase accessory factor